MVARPTGPRILEALEHYSRVNSAGNQCEPNVFAASTTKSPASMRTRVRNRFPECMTQRRSHSGNEFVDQSLSR